MGGCRKSTSTKIWDPTAEPLGSFFRAVAAAGDLLGEQEPDPGKRTRDNKMRAN